MKVSLNWVKQFIDFELPPIEELVQLVGARLGVVEQVINYGQSYQKVVIVRVETVQKHPNADRLNICFVNDGGVIDGVDRDANGLVQIVCGAANLREGMLAAWLPPGSIVPSTYYADQFSMETRELRGVVSNGMLASPKELAFSEDHEGILEVDIMAEPGSRLTDIYQLDDYVIDIENKMFTHRPDCFGQLGVAREIAGIMGRPFKSPDWYLDNTNVNNSAVNALPFELKNEIPGLVPRIVVAALGGTVIKPSPVIVQSYLQRVGIRPINNVVDVTNYIMMLTGQPLHAYDYDKVKALDGNDYATLTVRHPQNDETLSLLNGKTITPRSSSIIIASQTVAIGLGGVMGGADTEVGPDTKNILLECATFDMYSIRRTSMAHGLFSEAVSRFNKGQSPSQNGYIMQEAISMLQMQAGAVVDGKIQDFNQSTKSQPNDGVAITVDLINSRLGSQLDTAKIKHTLTNVEFAVDNQTENLLINPPFWRTDIHIAEDIIEEVGRLYGYDNLPVILPHREMRPVAANPMLAFKSTVRQIMAAQGANEVLTYSFVHGKLLDAVGQSRQNAFEISNALSPDLQYYRLTILPGLLEKVQPNLRAGYDRFVLFELGRTHMVNHSLDEQGLPEELHMFAAVLAQADKLAGPGAAYFELKHQLDSLAFQLGFKLTYTATEKLPDYNVTAPFDHDRSALVNVSGTDIFLGIIGEFKAGVRSKLKLPVHSAGFEIDTDALLKASQEGKTYRQVSKYPYVEQDICLRVPLKTNYQSVYDVVNEALVEQNNDQSTTTLAPLDIYQKDDYKQITLRYSIASLERTMTTAEVAVLLDSAASVAAAKLSAVRV